MKGKRRNFPTTTKRTTTTQPGLARRRRRVDDRHTHDPLARWLVHLRRHHHHQATHDTTGGRTLASGTTPPTILTPTSIICQTCRTSAGDRVPPSRLALRSGFLGSHPFTTALDSAPVLGSWAPGPLSSRSRGCFPFRLRSLPVSGSALLLCFFFLGSVARRVGGWLSLTFSRYQLALRSCNVVSVFLPAAQCCWIIPWILTRRKWRVSLPAARVALDTANFPLLTRNRVLNIQQVSRAVVIKHCFPKPTTGGRGRSIDLPHLPPNMRGHIEELSDAEGGRFKVRASHLLAGAPDPSVSGSNGSQRKATKIILKLSNGHSKSFPVQEPLAAKPRPRIIIKRPQRPVDLEEEARPADPLPSSPLFEESEDEKRKSRKHGKRRHRRIEEYMGYPEPSSPLFLEEEEEAVVEEEEEEEEEEEDEERTRRSRKHKKKRRKKLEMVDDSDDEDFDPMAEMRRKRSKARDSLVASAPTLPNLLVERIDILGDEATNKNLHEISRPAAAVPVISPGLGQRSDDNPIIKTLQKCHRIAASLKSELKATSTSEDAVNVDRYAEVDASAAKIVSQADVCAACGIAENDASRVLKPYQLVGVNFMLLLHRKNVGGAILADEMGLGKTVQAVAFLALLKHLDGDPGPHLLVAPASLLENWLREIRKWCPAFTVVLYHGNERAVQYERLHRAAKGKGPAPFNVMLTCYSLFERQSEQMKEDRKFLKKWDWSTVLMDEAHLLKDRGSYRSKRLRDVAQKAKQRVMLTGTPLQNDLQELWSLLEFMMPDIFDTSGVDLDQYLGTRNCTSGVLAQDKDLINHIKAILGPFVLRRVKSDVMRQLVAKTHEVLSVDMLEEQAAAYKQAVTEYRALAMAARASKTSKATSTNILDCLARRQVSNIFTQLRKLGNHPLLIRRIFTDETVKKLARKYHKMAVFGNECTVERVQEELGNYSDFTLHRMCLVYGGVPGGQGKLDDSHALASAKCQALVRLLPELKKEGHRPLIFSQWTNMLDILEWALAVIGFRFTRLDGSTPVTERQDLVDEYNSNPDIFVFLLSTRAGGQGLNLTGADTVIIHDVDFNPQMDRQAEDRCHRIGQTKPVTVYRLVTNGTVDESIFRIAKQKLVLDAAVLESGGDKESTAVQNERDVRTMGEILSALLAASTS